MGKEGEQVLTAGGREGMHSREMFPSVYRILPGEEREVHEECWSTFHFQSKGFGKI